MKKEKAKIKFVDVEKYGFVVEPRYYFFGWSKTAKIIGRESAVKQLKRAKKWLPKGYNFKIWDCQRTLSVQLKMIESFRRRIKLAHPDLDKTSLEKAVLGFAAKPVRKVVRMDTHRNGGSFDLTIIDDNGQELCMGTDHDDLTEKAATDYFEKKMRPNLLEKEARKNRRLLKRVMKKVGLINYSAEWWHWSWGK